MLDNSDPPSTMFQPTRPAPAALAMLSLLVAALVGCSGTAATEHRGATVLHRINCGGELATDPGSHTHAPCPSMAHPLGRIIGGADALGWGWLVERHDSYAFLLMFLRPPGMRCSVLPTESHPYPTPTPAHTCTTCLDRAWQHTARFTHTERMWPPPMCAGSDIVDEQGIRWSADYGWCASARTLQPPACSLPARVRARSARTLARVLFPASLAGGSILCCRVPAFRLSQRRRAC